MPVRIVTDSTSALPKALCQALGISVVPATIHFGSTTFIDGEDPAEEFYRQLIDSPVPPTTSTPSVGTFQEVFERLTQEGAEVVAIHLMETKSAIVSAARMAAEMLPGRPIHVVDSRTTTMGLGLIAMAAARAASAGESASQILGQVESLVARVDVHAVIREMTQLRRSGRVSLGKALLAGMLAIKPVLYLGKSAIEVVDQARGWPKAVDLMVDRALRCAGDARVHLVVLHTNAEAEALELLERVRHRFNAVEATVSDAGTAVAAHAGSGALGIATLRLD